MNLGRVNQWLTLLANFGVLGGIIFLALEIQQNTTAVRSSAIQESTNVARQQLLIYATDPELVRMNRTPVEQLTEIEYIQLASSSRSYWIGMQGLYRQWQMGVLPDEEWGMWQRIICANYARAKFWPSQAATLIPSFIQMVETCSGELDTKVAPFLE
jgi:hypothetical protein